LVRYEPDPRLFGLGGPATEPKDVRNVRDDYHFDASEMLKRVPSGYTTKRLVSTDAPVRNWVPDDSGLMVLPYPASGKEEANYELVFSPPKVSEQIIKSLRLQFVVNFGGFAVPLTNCRAGALWLNRDPGARIALLPDSRKQEYLIPVGNGHLTGIYAPDKLTVWPQNCPNVAADPPWSASLGVVASELVPGREYAVPVVGSPAHVFVSYVAATKGNDDRFQSRWASYLSLLDQIYKSGYANDISSDRWLYGIVFS
jgi:hypothetical protein